jgi:MFS family permease
MLLPAIPEIMKDFKVPYALAAWIFSGYMIVAAVMTPIAGKLSDIYGKKKILLTLLVVHVAATAAGGFTNTISFLLMIRIVQGVGLAAVPAAFSLLRDPSLQLSSLLLWEYLGLHTPADQWLASWPVPV